MNTALFYKKLDNEKVQCFLCPHRCIISNGKSGVCRVRINTNGQLFAASYGQICSFGFDPVEKKPLYHFYPGHTIFSIGSIGCNLRCKFCHNWEISQSSLSDFNYIKSYSPEEIIHLAKGRADNIGIAYTYNEPLVWYEFMMDVARQSADERLKNVMVTNGFINPGPLENLLAVMDAFNVDLKAFNNEFYKRNTSSFIDPVKETLKKISREGKHLEITNLLISEENDDKNEFEEMVKWISGELSPLTVLHISRYFPSFEMDRPATPPERIQEFYHIARRHLSHVYVGNMDSSIGQDTFCHKCGELLIHRNRYQTEIIGLDKTGKCAHCLEQMVTLG
jgi:pyruvate formate lyase activating enzyme